MKQCSESDTDSSKGQWIIS